MLINIRDLSLEVPDHTKVLTPPSGYTPKDFLSLTTQALDHPLDRQPLAQWALAGKKIALLVDDWGRPTPCSEFLPAVMERLHAAGARREDITIVTASGMHDPMDAQAMQRKVGREIYLHYRCISHDAGDPNMLTFVGITPMGTPVWANRYAVAADFRLTFGRVFPHICYGYEGGYKMIVPGIASFETILRDHSLNFSDNSTYAVIRDNASRAEADAVGRMVGIDMMVAYVMDWDDKPVAGFAGTVENTFPTCVNYGQRNVWGAVSGGRADITLLSAKTAGRTHLSQNPMYYLGMAINATKPDGILIADLDYVPPQKIVIDGVDMDEIPIDQLFRMHEKRNWNMNARQIQHAVKAIRGAFYYRRIFEFRSQSLFLASDTFPYRVLEKWNARQFAACGDAMREALSLKGADASVTIIPDGPHTLPLCGYDYPED